MITMHWLVLVLIVAASALGGVVAFMAWALWLASRTNRKVEEAAEAVGMAETVGERHPEPTP